MIMLIAIAFIMFGAGVLVGAHNVSTVDQAIVTLKQAETKAQAVLAKITAHKAA